MMYFTVPTANPDVHAEMVAGRLGFIDTPGQGNRHLRVPGIRWCADNGCFGKNFNPDRWWKFLVDSAHHAADCAFATAPDVVGDAAATIERSRPWLPKIRSLGYRAAFVAQDGSDAHPPPWGDFDVLFLGGTDRFKLGPEGHRVALEAKRRGLWLHCGRVNSKRRCRYAEALGCDSADGTFLKFAPTENHGRMQVWLDDLRDRPAMFTIGDTV